MEKMPRVPTKEEGIREDIREVLALLAPDGEVCQRLTGRLEEGPASTDSFDCDLAEAQMCFERGSELIERWKRAIAGQRC